ncbi:MAG TPA: gliding motility-associated C-terminal domain-containing protein [Dyadobacter sp.]|jgi:gliding motility-associated-like protein|nr:gliding motility-associated C-terminal domain-containing protein [Dyadobacter sp.]
MKGKLRLLPLLILYLLCLADVSAQTPFCENPNKGAFVLVDEDVCVGKAIQLTNQMMGAEYIKYSYKFDKAREDEPGPLEGIDDLSFVYNEAGLFTIAQWGSKGEGFALCKDVVVRETAAPNANLVTCGSGRVQLTLIEDDILSAYDQIEINWGDGKAPVYWSAGKPLIFNHEYPGNVPTIVITGKYNGNICASEIKPNRKTGRDLPPSLASIKIKRVEMSASGDAEVVYDAMEGVKTELFIAAENGSYNTTGKVSNEAGGEKRETLSNLDPDKVYHFKLISKDICDNPTESPVVSTVVLQKGTLVVDESNNLVWEAYADISSLQQYQLLRELGPDFTSTETAYSGSDRTDFLDNQLKCGTTYKYTLIAITNEARSYSAPITLEPTFPSPGEIKIAQVSVEAEDKIATIVNLTGVDGLTTLSNLIVERAQAGNSDFQKVSPDNNTTLSFTDAGLNTAQTSYCYRFIWENSCKQASPPSDVICSVLLTNNVQDIAWTAQSPFTSQVESYDLVSMDEAGVVKDEEPKNLETKHTVDLNADGKNTFKVRARSGGLESYSNVINLSGEVVMLIPDIFTPNGDTHNDKFEVKSLFTNTFRIRIYSRWGEVVFQSENTVDGWDGNINGKPAESGYYVYKIEATTSKDQPISKTGSLMLIR